MWHRCGTSVATPECHRASHPSKLKSSPKMLKAKPTSARTRFNRKKESEDQNTFDFMEEANQRGIFDDMSTRNLYEVEDFDVPAYIRIGVKIAI